MSPQLIETYLESMTKSIVEVSQPKQIILFGSYAKGIATADSDMDLLIVEDEPFSQSRSRRKEAAKIWQALMPFPIAKDILLYSSEEVARFKDEKNHVVGEAVLTGRVLYERK